MCIRRTTRIIAPSRFPSQAGIGTILLGSLFIMTIKKHPWPVAAVSLGLHPPPLWISRI